MHKILNCMCEDGDWQGLYLDGKLLYQEHTIEFITGLTLLYVNGVNLFDLEIKTVTFTMNEIEGMGDSFPDTVKELPRTK
jgi:hypothetical protein